MPDPSTEERAWGNALARAVTAISSTIAASVLVGFIAVVQNLSEQAPLITAHMQVTNQKLTAIEYEQVEQSKAMAALLKDYTSREQLQRELDKLNEKINELQRRQALIEQRLQGLRSRS